MTELEEKDVSGGPAAAHPIVEMTDADLAALLGRAVKITLVLGAVAAGFVWLAMGWRSAALMGVGAVISALSLLEWGRLIRLFNARLDEGKTPKGAGLVVALFLVRLVVFAGVIYGSLKGLDGSPLVLVAGLALAVVGLAWEALRVIRA